MIHRRAAQQRSPQTDHFDPGPMHHAREAHSGTRNKHKTYNFLSRPAPWPESSAPRIPAMKQCCVCVTYILQNRTGTVDCLASSDHETCSSNIKWDHRPHLIDICGFNIPLTRQTPCFTLYNQLDFWSEILGRGLYRLTDKGVLRPRPAGKLIWLWQ